MPRISLAGCGRWGRNILRDLLTLGCEVAVADISEEARDFARAAGAATAVSAVESLPGSDGIVIASSTSTHALTIEQALVRGVPVFVEKPMTCDSRDANRLLAAAAGRLFVMDKWRYHPGIEQLRAIADGGELGRPLGLHLQHTGWGQPHQDVDVTWILLPHCLAIALEVLGRVPPAIHAFAERLNGETVGLAGVLGPDPWISLEVSARSPVKRREFRLHCTEGVAWIDEGWTKHVKIARGIGLTGGDAVEVERRTISGELPLLRELRAFIEHLDGGPAPRSSAEEGVLIVDRIHDLRRLAGLK
jgi:predicted dehydrogenase